MREIPVGGSAQIERRVSSSWVRVLVENSSVVLTEHAPFEIEYEDPRADAPIGAATIRFRRGQGANSLAPLMTANPPIDIGRRITIDIDAGDGSWTPVFSGRIDRVEWPEKYGDLTIEARDDAGVIMDTFIEEERAYGSEAGEPIEDVIQAIADDNLEDPPTLYAPTPTGAVVLSPPDYVPSDIATFEAMQYVAGTIGALVRMRHIDSEGAWRLAIIEPERDKTVPDHEFTGSMYYDVSRMDLDIEDIFNVWEVEYSDAAGVRRRVKVEDSASITKYGRRYARINEASDSPVRDGTAALALANAALSDTAEPDATMEIRCAYFWPGEVGIDLYRFHANNVHFSSDQDLAPVAIKHRLAVNERPESWITVRGKPSAGVLLWRQKARNPAVAELPENLKITAVNRVGETGEFVVEFGGAVEEADVHWRVFDLPLPDDHLAQLYSEVNLREILTASGESFTATLPQEDQELWYAVIPRATGPRYVDVSGDAWEGHVEGGRAPITFTVEAPENDAGTQATLTVTIGEDPRGVVSGVRMWEQRKGVETGPFSLTAAGAVYTRTFDLLPKPHVVLVRGEILRNDSQPAIPFGPISADSDKSANVVSVTPSISGGTASYQVQFDSDTEVGTDTAGYRLDGGAETLIDVDSGRRAVINVTQSESATILLEIRGYNEAGQPGDWFPVTVPIYTPPAPLPASIASVTLAVISIDAGANDQYVVSISTVGTVATATHAFRIELYSDGALVHAEAAHDPESGPLIQVETAASPGALYHARVRLYQLSDGAVLSDVTTLPVTRS